MKRIESFKVFFRNILYHIQYWYLSKERRNIHVMSPDESIEYILNRRCSISRLGDGELDMIACLDEGYDDSRRSAFQVFDPRLAERLKEIVSSPYYEDYNIAIGIPYVMFNMNGLKTRVKKFWRRNYVNNHVVLRRCLAIEGVYIDTNFTRFYIDHIRRTEPLYIEKLKMLWDKRDLCFVEGCKTRMGVGNDLFANANSIIRIACPAVNAFDKYEKIMSAIEGLVVKESLIILALGQTATVLAFDLAKRGYQALDLGHIDVEYEWYRMAAKDKVALANKYVNEVVDGRIVGDIADVSYKRQIVAVIE